MLNIRIDWINYIKINYMELLQRNSLKKKRLWSREQQDILSMIEKNKNANANYFDQGIKILKLT